MSRLTRATICDLLMFTHECFSTSISGIKKQRALWRDPCHHSFFHCICRLFVVAFREKHAFGRCVAEKSRIDKAASFRACAEESDLGRCFATKIHVFTERHRPGTRQQTIGSSSTFARRIQTLGSLSADVSPVIGNARFAKAAFGAAEHATFGDERWKSHAKRPRDAQPRSFVFGRG